MTEQEIVSVKRLPSGYYHIRGIGLCNWAQPREWPCDPAELEEAFFHEAGRDFRRAVAIENEKLLEAEGS